MSAALLAIAAAVVSCSRPSDQADSATSSQGEAATPTYPLGQRFPASELPSDLLATLDRYFFAVTHGDAAAVWPMLDDQCHSMHGSLEAFRSYFKANQIRLRELLEMFGAGVDLTSLELDQEAARAARLGDGYEYWFAVRKTDGAFFVVPDSANPVRWVESRTGWRTNDCVDDQPAGQH